MDLKGLYYKKLLLDFERIESDLYNAENQTLYQMSSILKEIKIQSKKVC